MTRFKLISDKLFELYVFFAVLNYRSIGIILKNGKSMASIAILSSSFLYISIFFFSYAVKYWLSSINNTIMEPYSSISPAPDSPQTADAGYLQPIIFYLVLILLLELFLIFFCLMISNIASVATILTSAASHSDKNLPLQDLLSRILKTWSRPLKTTFRTSRTRTMKYTFLVLFSMGFLSFLYPDLFVLFAVVAGIFLSVFSIYSGVVWILATVVSVVEERSGDDALRKAEELVKGQRVHGVLLNVFFNLLGLITALFYWLIFGEEGFLNLTASGLLLLSVSYLVKMYALVAYTVMYFECKRNVGEDVEFLEAAEYTKVPTYDIVP